MGTLKTALFWSAMERFGLQGTQMLLTIVLARILSPLEYGLIGMVAIFLSVGQVFADSGLSTALMQRPYNSADDETTVFYLNIGAGAALTLIICAVSPLVADFFGQPVLMPLLCFLSLQVLLSSFGLVQFALLARTMDFRRQAIVSSVSVLTAGLVGIGMALKGMGVWSLVGQSLTTALLRSVLIWRLSKWRPTGHFRHTSFRAMWPFSSRLLASVLLNTVFENLYNVVIGRVYRPVDLGLFTRARTLAQFPAGLVTTIISQTTLPTFSRLQTDPVLLRVSVRKVFRLVAAGYFPAMAALAVVADPLVRVLLTDKWIACVPYLHVLSFAGMLYPMHALHLNVLLAQGRSDLFLRLEVVKKALTVLTIVTTFRFGVFAMVWGILFLSLVCLAVNGYYSRKLLRYLWWEQTMDLAPVLGATAITALAMVAVKYLDFVSSAANLGSLHPGNPLVLLLVQMAVGLIAYGTIAGLSPMSTYVDFRAQVMALFCSYSETRSEGSA
jgi:teichuronic acid exporter